VSAERVPPLGALRDRVLLQRKEQAVTPDGGVTALFMPIASIWARVRGLTSRLGESADARVAIATHSVVIRFRLDVRPGDRLVFRGRALEVVAAADLNGRRAYLSCSCREVAGA